MRHPDDALVARIQDEITLVLAFLPWLPRPGIRVGAGRPAHSYDGAERAHYISIPSPYWVDDATLRRLIRHEMGHLWESAMGLRLDGYDAAVALGIDPTAPTPHECVADVFCRVMGSPSEYPALAQYTEPTPARAAAITASGALPDALADQVALGRAIAAFWGRDDIPEWFRTWAGNYQRWLDLNVGRLLRLL